MSDKLDLKTTSIVSVLAGIFAGIFSFIILQFPLPEGSIGVFPLADNLVQVLSIVLGVSTAPLVVERYFDRDLYDDKEVVAGAIVISVISVFTVGLGVPPFNVAPYWLAVTATVIPQAMFFTWFVLPYSREYDFI